MQQLLQQQSSYPQRWGQRWGIGGRDIGVGGNSNSSKGNSNMKSNKKSQSIIAKNMQQPIDIHKPVHMNNENTNPALLGKQQDLHPHRSHSNNNNNNNNNKNEQYNAYKKTNILYPTNSINPPQTQSQVQPTNPHGQQYKSKYIEFGKECIVKRDNLYPSVQMEKQMGPGSKDDRRDCSDNNHIGLSQSKTKLYLQQQRDIDKQNKQAQRPHKQKLPHQNFRYKIRNTSRNTSRNKNRSTTTIINTTQNWHINRNECKIKTRTQSNFQGAENMYMGRQGNANGGGGYIDDHMDVHGDPQNQESKKIIHKQFVIDHHDNRNSQKQSQQHKKSHKSIITTTLDHPPMSILAKNHLYKQTCKNIYKHQQHQQQQQKQSQCSQIWRLKFEHFNCAYGGDNVLGMKKDNNGSVVYGHLKSNREIKVEKISTSRALELFSKVFKKQHKDSDNTHHHNRTKSKNSSYSYSHSHSHPHNPHPHHKPELSLLKNKQLITKTSDVQIRQLTLQDKTQKPKIIVGVARKPNINAVSLLNIDINQHMAKYGKYGRYVNKIKTNLAMRGYGNGGNSMENVQNIGCDNDGNYHCQEDGTVRNRVSNRQTISNKNYYNRKSNIQYYNKTEYNNENVQDDAYGTVDGKQESFQLEGW